MRHKSFNSLQTGRSFRTSASSMTPSSLMCFNSLQTGRSFRTAFLKSSLRSAIKFQFPSNGKVFPNSKTRRRKKTRSVLCFNSLQTGRSFRTHLKIRDAKDDPTSFNSLQTGRSFRTYPSVNPVTVRAKIAKTKHELRGGFFCENYY